MYLFEIIFGGVGTGSAPPGVLANAYANFGFLASLIEYTVVFLILFGLEALFARGRDPVSLACRAWLTTYGSQVIFAGSSAAVLMSPSLIFAVLLHIVVRATSRTRSGWGSRPTCAYGH